MSLLCRSKASVTRRNAVVTRLGRITAKSLKTKQRGSRNAVVTWRNAAGAKSLKTLVARRNAAGPPTKVGEGRPGCGLPFPFPFSIDRVRSQHKKEK